MTSMRIRSSTQIPPTAPPIGGPRLGPTGISSVRVEPVVVGVGDGDAVAARKHVVYTLKCSNYAAIIGSQNSSVIVGPCMR